MADVHDDARVPRASRRLVAAARRRRRASSSSPVKQCVRMSPGRINASTSSISGGPKAMCTISGSSHSSAARRASRSGSRPLLADGRRAHPHLDAADEVAVRVGEAPEEVDVEVGEVRALVVLADEADVRDVEERVDAHARAGRRRTRAGPAASARPPSRRRSTSSRRTTRGDRIGVDAPVGDLVEDVRVQVDEPRRDDLARRRRSRGTRPPRGSSRSTAAMRSRVDGDVEAALRGRRPGSTTSPPLISRSNRIMRLERRADPGRAPRAGGSRSGRSRPTPRPSSRARASFAARFSARLAVGRDGRSTTESGDVAERAAVRLEVEPDAVDVGGVGEHLHLGADGGERGRGRCRAASRSRRPGRPRACPSVALDRAARIHEDEPLARRARDLGGLRGERGHRVGPHVEVREQLAAGDVGEHRPLELARQRRRRRSRTPARPRAHRGLHRARRRRRRVAARARQCSQKQSPSR